MRIKHVVFLCFAVWVVSGLNAQNSGRQSGRNYLTMSWKQLAAGASQDWLASSEAKIVADKLIRTQRAVGGWEKNINYNRLSEAEVQAFQDSSNAIGATIDNGSTITELKFLAKVYEQQKDERYKKAVEKGINYLLTAQYKSGGWPQFYPARKGVSYASHITYNDDAMINVLEFLQSIDKNERPYTALNLPQATKAKIKTAIDKGIDCILKTQIIVAGKPTVWCAQHDEVTLLPANARAYELASFSGSESVGITLFLMNIPNPSKAIANAVEGAVQWFADHQLQHIKLTTVVKDGKRDRVIVEDPAAEPLWARFYDLETGKPFFCGRDGIKRNSMAEIESERRNGYSWYTTAPSKVLEKYTSWKANK